MTRSASPVVRALGLPALADGARVESSLFRSDWTGYQSNREFYEKLLYLAEG